MKSALWVRSRSNSKNKTEIVKVLNRGKLVYELKDHIQCDLEELGYDELDIEIMYKNALQANSLDVLPLEVRERYTIKPYVRQYSITDETAAGKRLTI